MASEPALVVISGTQGAGKSTVARQLAGSLARAAWVSADTLQEMIVAGGQWPERRDMSADADLQLRLRLRNACLLARSFVAAGFSAVVDDIVIGERVDHLLEEMAGHRFVFVMLTPRPEIVRARERGRGTELWLEWEWLSEVIERRTRRIGLWLDSSEQTPDQTVAEILSRGWSEGVVEAPPLRPRPAG